MNSLDRLLTTITQAPATQMDPSICAKVKRLIGCPNAIVATEMKEILRDAGKDKSFISKFSLNILQEVVIIAEIEKS